jgi:hypothetical protein
MIRGISPAVVLGGVAALAALSFPWFGILGSDTPVGVPGDSADMAVSGDSDVFDEVWHFWWVRTAVSEGRDPMYCPLIYHPRGASLALHNVGWTSALFMSLPGMPRNPVRALNLALFLGTLLTFAGGAFLARRWDAPRDGAVVAGMIMALMPCRTVHMLQHYMVAQIGWVLLALGFFTGYLRNRRGLLFIGLFAFLAVMESFYHGLLLAAGAAAASLLAPEKPSVGRLFRGWAAVAAGFALASLWFIPRGGPVYTESMSWREAVHWSAEPVSYALPSSLGAVGRLAGLPLKYPWMPNAFEGQVSCGLAATALLALVCLKGRRLSLALVCLGIMILSFGPLLKMGGRATPIPLPWMIPARLPFFAQARVPARLGMLLGIIAGVTAGAAFRHLGSRARRALLTLLALDLFIPSLPVLPASIPEACRSVRGPVLDLPASPSVRITALYQTAHRRPRLTAFLARGGFAAYEEAGLSSLGMNDSTTITPQRILATEAETVLYHRMLLPPESRMLHDSLYAPLFPGASPDDSVWVWRR